MEIQTGCFKTDLYQILMMAAHYKKGLTKKIITCEAFARKMPKARNFFVMCGLPEIVKYISKLKFNKDDIRFLKEQPILKDILNSTNFDMYLKDFRFTGSLYSMAEGEALYQSEPIIRITAPLPEANLVETYILSVLNYDISVASKAARIVLAARGKPVVDFSTRRTHPDAAINAARASYIAGFNATSNIEAGRRFDIPIKGTMNHMWVMVHDDERKAYEGILDSYKSPVFLIDTFDTINGAKLVASLKRAAGVRLDSGDFNTLSREVRNILNNAGKRDVKIIVSGDMDEYKIDKLKDAPIDSFGVGTKLVSHDDAPSLGLVYKAVYDNEKSRNLIKFSSDRSKITFPGVKQVFIQDDGSHIVAIDGESISGTSLLDCYIKDGEVLEFQDDKEQTRRARIYCNASLTNLPSEVVRFSDCGKYPVSPHVSLKRAFENAVQDYRSSLE